MALVVPAAFEEFPRPKHVTVGNLPPLPQSLQSRVQFQAGGHGREAVDGPNGRGAGWPKGKAKAKGKPKGKAGKAKPTPKA